MNPTTYEAIRIAEKQRLFERPTRYTINMFNEDFEILMNLYTLYKKRRDNEDIDIYFKIKFFRQLEKIPFMNPLPYMTLDNGIHLAIKDTSILSFSYFFI